MSRHLELAPFAITSDGTLFVNVAKLTTASDFEEVVRDARAVAGVDLFDGRHALRGEDAGVAAAVMEKREELHKP